MAQPAESEFREDICEVCKAPIGFGWIYSHLGICDDCADKADRERPMPSTPVQD